MGLAHPERSIDRGNGSSKFTQFLFENVSHLLPVDFLMLEMACFVTLPLNLDCDKPRCSTITDHHFEACTCAYFLFNGNHPYQLQSIIWLCSVMTKGIIQYLYRANHQLHEVQVAYLFCFMNFTNHAAFPIDQSVYKFPKNAPIKTNNANLL